MSGAFFFVSQKERTRRKMFFKFDKDLLNIEISPNAKILYMILYDILRAKNKNKEINERSVTVKQTKLSEIMHLSKRQIIKLLNELEENELIQRKRVNRNDINSYIIFDINKFEAYEK